MAHMIKAAFLDELKNGSLKPLLEYVQLDDTLNMELRGDRITVYYRGGALLSVKQDSYSFESLDKKYHIGISFAMASISNIEDYIPKAKHIIDIYINTVKNHLGEKEIQQNIARENNYSPNSIDTDYFVIDTEYQDLGRFDIVALRWDSKSNIRKLPTSYLPTITIFEVKQGYNSISGKSGMESHFNDFNVFCSTKNIVSFKSDMINVFNQKRSLGLISDMGKYKDVKEVADEVEFVFLLANYKHGSKQLSNELKKIVKCKFIYSNFMGYGLYSRNIVNNDNKDFIKMFL